MRKIVKVSLIGLASVTIVMTIAVAYFASTFDINDYRARIIQEVNAATGRTLTVDGDIRLSFFPHLSVRLEGLSLSNAQSFGDTPMVQSSEASVSVRLLPLLKGDVRFGHLTINDLALHLGRREDGVSNWDDLVGRIPAAETEASSLGDEPFSLDISGVSLKNASFYWDDRQSDTHFILHGIVLETGRVYEGSPIPVQASLDFECARPDVKGRLTLSGKSSLDFANRKYGHMDMQVNLEAEGESIPGGRKKGELSVRFAVFDFIAEHAQVTGLTAKAYGATVHADGTINGITDGLKKLVGTVSVEPLDAGKFLRALGLELSEMSDPKALTNVSGRADVTYTPSHLEVMNLVGEVDGCNFTGSGKLESKNEKPFLFIRLDAGKLDLDRYLPSDHEERKQEVTKDVKKGRKVHRVLHSERLQNLQLDIEAKVADLRIEKIHLQKVHAAIEAQDGIVRASPLKADLYGGQLSSSLTINAQGKLPQSAVVTSVKSVDVGELFKDLLGNDEYDGILTYSSALSCKGEHLHTMLQSAAGKVSFDFKDGVFPGVDLIKMAKRTHANKGKKKGEVLAEKGAVTRYGNISGSGRIVSGILYNKDLELKAPGLWANGEGTVTLQSRELDYLLNVKLIPIKHEKVDSSDDLFGVTVPIRVSGTVENPHYWVSVTEYVKSLGGAVISVGSSILGGVFDAIKSVGEALDSTCCEDEK